MKIIDEATLDLFRCRPCEWNNCHQLGEPAHVYAKGHGGGLRLDHRLNLVSLCRDHHLRNHAGGRPNRMDLIDLVAKREGMAAHEVVTSIHAMQRMMKDGKEPNLKPTWESAK